MTLGQRVRFLREQRGFSQTRLAHLAGWTPSTLCMLERGQVQDMLLSRAQRLARVLGCSLETLAGQGDDMAAAPWKREVPVWANGTHQPR
jgi:transcriptional regulator with XRE-family HTH domain